MRLPDGFTTRSLTIDDAPQVFALIAAAETEDIGEPALDVEDVLAQWQRPSFDLATQALGVEQEGRLVAYAEVSGGRYADGAVPPSHRRRGIGTALALWSQAEARRQCGTAVGMPVPQGSAGDHLLASLGYGVAWTSWVLELPAGVAIAPQALPSGYALRGARASRPGAAGGLDPDDERAAYRVVEDAFGEWPDRPPQTFEDWAARTVRRPGFEPGQLRLVENGAGDVVGVSVLLVGGDVGAIDNLAVRKDERGRGLARALLVDSFAEARRRGATRSELSTDSRTGALGLYERVGMVVTSTWLHRVVDL